MQVAMERVASARGLMVVVRPSNDMLPSPLFLLLSSAPPRTMMDEEDAASSVTDVDCDVASASRPTLALFDLDLLVVAPDDDPPPPPPPPPRRIVAICLAELL